MKYWLVVYMLLNGVWTPGSEVRPMGWHPRAYPSREACEERRVFAMKAVERTSKTPSKWFCTTTPHAPLEQLEREAARAR